MLFSHDTACEFVLAALGYKCHLFGALACEYHKMFLYFCNEERGSVHIQQEKCGAQADKGYGLNLLLGMFLTAHSTKCCQCNVCVKAGKQGQTLEFFSAFNLVKSNRTPREFCLSNGSVKADLKSSQSGPVCQ